MKKCPICKIELNEPIPDFCETCGWELRSDLTLVPSIDLPESAIDDYNKRKEIAQCNWLKILQADEQKKALEKLEERLRRIEKRLFSQEETEFITSPEKASTQTGRDDAKVRQPASFSERDALPQLTRDPFETVEEFEERIGLHPPVPVGKAELIKNEYDIETGRFPLTITWDIEPDVLSGIPADIAKPCILAERDIARAMYENSRRHPVFATLSAKRENVTVLRTTLAWDNREFEISGSDAEICEPIAKSPISIWVEPITDMEFVKVPGGTFEMGDLFDEGFGNEKPVHEVDLLPFFIGRYPVTQGQWKAVTGRNPSVFQKGDEYPVEKVSWYDAKNFIRKLSGLNDGKYVFCLPSEAQWEYAARSGGKMERYAGGDNIDEVAWYKRNSNGSTQPVGSKKPNGLGIFDMSGNVREWVEDEWHRDYAGAPQNGRAWVNEARGMLRAVARGGSWDEFDERARVACRMDFDPRRRHEDLGFRLVFISA